MRLMLPYRKRLDILRICKSALKKPQIFRINLERIIGNLNWAASAVNFAPAHFRGLQILLNSRPDGRLIRSRESFTFSIEARKDLLWWLSEADFTSCRPLIFPALDLSIASDASLSGWGAVCKEIRTGGPWTKDERKEHINFLELLAALKALQCFTATARDATVELRMDNTSAVSYINRMGGCKSANLCGIALNILEWCECRRLSLCAVFVPGVTNILADAESRRPLSSGDWKLDPQSFKAIQAVWEVKVDLFASSWNAQLLIFVSRFPQPGAWSTDALSLNWKALAGYCPHPLST